MQRGGSIAAKMKMLTLANLFPSFHVLSESLNVYNDIKIYKIMINKCIYIILYYLLSFSGGFICLPNPKMSIL